MAKTSTLFSNGFVNSPGDKNIKEKALQENQYSPNDAVITNILAFSKALIVEQSAQAGPIEIVLN